MESCGLPLLDFLAFVMNSAATRGAAPRNDTSPGNLICCLLRPSNLNGRR